MKRFLALLAAVLTLFLLTGCSHAAGGSYKLEYITADGMRIPPTGYGLNISLELAEDGVGTANYSGTVLNITWEEDGSEVIITGPNGTLTFSKDGKALVLHDEGTLLYFTPVEEK